MTTALTTLLIVFALLFAFLFYFGLFLIIRWLGRLLTGTRTGVSEKVGERHERQEDPLPYRKKDFFFTVAERIFFSTLQTVAAKYNLCVFGKVRLEDLLWLPYMAPSTKLYFRGKVRSRHIDFVLCDMRDYRVRAAVELDDSSHDLPERIERDKFVDQALGDAGVPVLRVRVAHSYDANELESRISKLISGSMHGGK